MGFLTTITIHNDALHVFEKHPKEFAEAIFNGMTLANCARKRADVPFENYSGYITIEPSRHADDETVYLHSGNTVFNMNAWNDDFNSLLIRNPEVAKDFLRKAERILKTTREKVRAHEKLAKSKKS
jgi:hypothetical protein